MMSGKVLLSRSIIHLKSVHIVLWLMFMLASCRSRENSEAAIFRYNETTGISSLDPAFARNQAVMWPVHQLFNTLVEVDSSMRIIPSLASSWTISPDRLHLIFRLRTDVRFHDDPCFPGGQGRLMKASDVVFSLGRIMDPLTASPGAWIFNDRLDKARPLIALNDSTVQINLVKPFQPILGILSMKYCSILAPEAVRYYGKDIGRHPVGTGPFYMIRWHENEALILARNERYFERDEQGNRLPYLEGIRVSFFDNKLTEFMEFRQGKIDFMNDLDATMKDELLTKTGHLKKEWEGKLLMQTCPYLNIEYLGILQKTMTDQEPLSDARVRRAIGLCINRKKMLMYLRNSIGQAAEGGFIPPGLPSLAQEKINGFSYDPLAAKSLLDSAGYGPGGKKMPEIILKTVPNYASLGSYIVNELRQMGIPAQVEVLQKTVLLDQMSGSSVPFFRGSWIADYPDAENYLSVFYGKNPAPPNYTRYRNAQFDQWYEQAVSETNDSLRLRLYHRMDSLVMSSSPVIPLWYDQVLHIINPGVKGMKPNSLNMLDLRRVKKDR